MVKRWSKGYDFIDTLEGTHEATVQYSLRLRDHEAEIKTCGDGIIMDSCGNQYTVCVET